MLPLVSDFLSQVLAIIIVELLDVIDLCWTLRDQGTLGKSWQDVLELKFSSELLDIPKQLVLWNPNERVLDPTYSLSEATIGGWGEVMTNSPVMFSVRASKVSLSWPFSTNMESLRFSEGACAAGATTGSVAGLLWFKSEESALANA